MSESKVTMYDKDGENLGEVPYKDTIQVYALFLTNPQVMSIQRGEVITTREELTNG